jgi:hypothetical protein
LGCRVERERRRHPLRGEALREIGQIVKRPALTKTNGFEGFRRARNVIVRAGGETGAARGVIEAAQQTGRFGFDIPNFYEALVQGDRQPVAGRHPGNGVDAASHL